MGIDPMTSYRGMIRVAKGPSPHSVPKKTKKIAVPPQHRGSKESPFLYGISNFLFSPRGSDGNLFSKITAALQHFWPFFKQAEVVATTCRDDRQKQGIALVASGACGSNPSLGATASQSRQS